MSKEVQKTMSPTGMLAFDKNLFEGDEKGRFSAALVLDKDSDLKEIKKLIKAAAVKKFGPEVEMGDILLPYKEVTNKKQLKKSPFLEGKYVLNAKNGFEFPVVDRNTEEITRADIKGGDEVRFSLSFYGWEYQGKEMVCANLLAVQKVADGEALWSKPSGKDHFTAIETDNDDFESEDDDF